eukprot:TRINITY_DN2226_c0_g1_i1.p2 TRINITY_DN2226_c0_g1~~TRINITY_DN2226_c0_g1_i1.p2  ORF type:complete len:192 (-),score=24.44 TRINITY_DN2226_c0_g1_i1:31-606(-)
MLEIPGGDLSLTTVDFRLPRPRKSNSQLSPFTQKRNARFPNWNATSSDEAGVTPATDLLSDAPMLGKEESNDAANRFLEESSQLLQLLDGRQETAAPNPTPSRPKFKPRQFELAKMATDPEHQEPIDWRQKIWGKINFMRGDPEKVRAFGRLVRQVAAERLAEQPDHVDFVARNRDVAATVAAARARWQPA